MTLQSIMGRFGPTINPKGMHVTMPWQGRTLLGEITGMHYRESPGGFVVTVKHFSGEPWPVNPIPPALTVLERTP